MRQYFVKIGDFYVTSAGTLSTRQVDALKVDVPTSDYVRDVGLATVGISTTPRMVRVRPRTSRHQTANATNTPTFTRTDPQRQGF